METEPGSQSPSDPQPTPWPFGVLLEDGPLLAVNKPAGLLTQGVPAGLPSLESAVRDYLRFKYQKPGNVYLGIPHRLDRPVSGVVVFARNSKAAARLAEEFRERRVRKIYWALLEAPPDPPAGLLVDWLKKVPDQARVERVSTDEPQAQEARLHYRVRQTGVPLVGPSHLATWVELEPVTGRMHQIRVQLAARGWPIWGDQLYGGQYAWPRAMPPGEISTAASTSGDSTVSPAPTLLQAASPPEDHCGSDHSHSERPIEPAIALHARQLILRHPIRYDRLSIDAPVPATWPEMIRAASMQPDPSDSHPDDPVRAPDDSVPGSSPLGQ